MIREVGDVGETDPLGVDDADVRLGGVGAFSGDSEERFGEKRDLSGVLDLRSGDELRRGDDDTRATVTRLISVISGITVIAFCFS